MDEKDIRGIYEGFYKIAEIIGKENYTHLVNQKLHLLVKVIPILTTNELGGLTKVIESLDGEYSTKFIGLENKQKEGYGK